MKDPTLDRQEIERLFQIQKRTALLLMRAVGPSSSGTSFVVDRKNLIHWVESIDQTEGQELVRRRNVLEKIDTEMAQYRALRQALHEEGRKILKFPIVQDVMAASIDALPHEIQITPGQIVIHVPTKDAVEACQLLHALGVAITGDVESFIDRISGSHAGIKVSA